MKPLMSTDPSERNKLSYTFRQKSHHSALQKHFLSLAEGSYCWCLKKNNTKKKTLLLGINNILCGKQWYCSVLQKFVHILTFDTHSAPWSSFQRPPCEFELQRWMCAEWSAKLHQLWKTSQRVYIENVSCFPTQQLYIMLQSQPSCCLLCQWLKAFFLQDTVHVRRLGYCTKYVSQYI